MSKDEHGNCSYCTMGKYQPIDLDDKPEAVQCQMCDKGTFAEMMFDEKEFEKMPEWLNRQKCAPITPSTSASSCLFHQRKWRAHLDSIRADTGIPKGLRVSIGGNMRIGSELGGSMTIEFLTYKLRRGESFIIFIDAKEVANVKLGHDKDNKGYSLKKM